MAVDTYYFEGNAKTVGLLFSNWKDRLPDEIISEVLRTNNPYESGAFYKKELPCITSLLKKIDLIKIDTIIVDGFVVLDDNGKLGLGGYLFEYLHKKIPVIGVAKNNFLSLHAHKDELRRGKSNKPLYITSLGIDLETATEKIRSMEGNFRIPTLLKMADQISREK